jgi:hypothetical protein
MTSPHSSYSADWRIFTWLMPHDRPFAHVVMEREVFPVCLRNAAIRASEPAEFLLSSFRLILTLRNETDSRFSTTFIFVVGLLPIHAVRMETLL